jgi:hypothetical protein
VQWRERRWLQRFRAAKGGVKKGASMTCILKVLAERPEGLRKACRLAKRTRGGVEGRCPAVMLARLRHSTQAGKSIVLFPVVYNEAKFYS